MATATKVIDQVSTVVVDKVGTLATLPDGVTLYRSDGEARALAHILGQVGGPGSLRNALYRIDEALDTAGYSFAWNNAGDQRKTRRLEPLCTGSIFCREVTDVLFD